MLDIDLRSINLMTGLMCVVMGLVMSGTRRHFPRTLSGLGIWASGPLVGVFATVFYGLEGLIAPPWAALLGNTFAMSSCALMYLGSQQFLGQKPDWVLWGGVVGLSLCALAYFLWVQPDYRVRMAIFTGVLSILFVTHARLLMRRGQGFAARLAMAVMWVQASVFVLRFGAVPWIDAADSNRFAPSIVHSTYIVSFGFLVLLFLIASQLMASERLRAEFEHLATYDSLTGALNRRMIQLAGEHELTRWERHGHPFAVLMIDIDHFKHINDRHGHAVGDDMLRRFVLALREPIRATDLVGRYGGEEFLVLLPMCDQHMAVDLAERLCRHVQATVLLPGGIPCTASIGVGWVQPGDTGFDTLITRADTALYRAKGAGRNRVVAAQQMGEPCLRPAQAKRDPSSTIELLTGGL